MSPRDPEKRRPVNSLLSIVIVAAGAYALILLFLFVNQSRLLYLPDLPSRTLGPGPDAVGLAYETIHIVTEDDVRLHGWFVPSPSPRGVVLFFHGNAGNISHRLDSLKIFHDLKFSTLIVDYRGYGASEGRISENGTYRDAEAAWRYLTEERGVPAAQIVLFGRSLGGAVAAYLASRQDPAALIVESGFVSVPDMAAKLYPWFPARWLARIGYPTGEFLGAATCPVLIVHSRDDEIIPYDQGEALFERAGQPKQFLTLRGDHNGGFLLSGRHYHDGLDAFLSSISDR
jgi:fermentation-respiration switch protein FrsA (DUF1100 family)